MGLSELESLPWTSVGVTIVVVLSLYALASSLATVVKLDIPATRDFQIHFHFQLNCNTTKPTLILTLSISL